MGPGACEDGRLSGGGQVGTCLRAGQSTLTPGLALQRVRQTGTAEPDASLSPLGPC